MLKLFKLIGEEFVNGELRWTYETKITFDYQLVVKITITNHFEKKHGDTITKELILKMLEKMDKQILKPLEYYGRRKPYKWETTLNEKKYRLIFWFEDSNSDWLWIPKLLSHQLNQIKV